MIDFIRKDFYECADLAAIVRALRSPEGCPWDRVQTHESLRRNFLEESYEAVEAIDSADAAALCEELGDVLLQVIFHALLAEEAGAFTLSDVVTGICQKLLYRHPHVFSDAETPSAENQLAVWEALKRSEKGQVSIADSVDAVAKTLPALWRAEKMQKKTGESLPLLDSLAAVDASRAAVDGSLPAVGDLLFAATKVARSCGVDPEEALHDACARFAAQVRSLS